MIVDQIDVRRIAILKTKHDSPVTRNRQTPEPLPLATQLVQSPTGEEPEFRELFRGLQRRENSSQACSEICRYETRVVLFEESL